MSRLRSRPPAAEADEFIAGSERKEPEVVEKPAPKPAPQPARQKVRYPWDSPTVREDVAKVYNLRLPEPYLLKLKYIAEHTPHSMQKFCLDVLLPEIDKKIRELT